MQQTRNNRVFAAAWCAAFLLALPAQPAVAQQTGAPTVSAAEADFWRSTDRIGTPDAYRAYLAVFPNGLYVPLAKAALTKGDGSVLRSFRRDAENSGQVTFQLGDRFAGPGAITVGRFGSKKEILLPAGEWVVLAAVDSRSMQTVGSAQSANSESVEVGSIVFGRFSGLRLVTLLRFTFNGRRVAVPTWSDLAGCDAGGSQRLRHERATVSNWRDECLSSRSLADPFAEDNPERAELLASLAQLGATVSGAALVNTASIADRGNGYLGINRIDWPGSHLGASADAASAWTTDGVAASPDRRAYADAAASWMKGYRDAARAGYLREHPGPALSPGGLAPTGPVPAGLDEWPTSAAGR
jgi:hypothetical protein